MRSGHHWTMDLNLTQHDEIRRRILSVLSSTDSGELTPAEMHDRMKSDFPWTAEDQPPFPKSRTREAKWWKRTKIERNTMANDGLIDRDEVRAWKLTDKGWAESRYSPVVAGDSPDRSGEAGRREQLWASLLAQGGPADVRRGRLRELGIYGNQAGIYVPSAETRTPDTPKGIALSFLHTGKHYDDELTETGVIYHYPKTARSGHDESEIEASKAAYRASLPVFVIGPGNKSTTRTVHRGYIEDVDDSNRVLLITFTRAELPPPPTINDSNDPFDLTDPGTTPTYSARRNRPNQVRFAFDVFKRYGSGCAVCWVDVPGLVQAAHLLAKSKGGSDDARNGLPLCANHHLALDRGYWSIDAEARIHGETDGPTCPEIGIIRKDLSHLPHRPHRQALETIWTYWLREQEAKRR